MIPFLATFCRSSGDQDGRRGEATANHNRGAAVEGAGAAGAADAAATAGTKTNVVVSAVDKDRGQQQVTTALLPATDQEEEKKQSGSNGGPAGLRQGAAANEKKEKEGSVGVTLKSDVVATV